MKIVRSIRLPVAGVVLDFYYIYDVGAEDLEELRVYVPEDNRGVTDLHDFVWPRFEDQIYDAILRDVKANL